MNTGGGFGRIAFPADGEGSICCGGVIVPVYHSTIWGVAAGLRSPRPNDNQATAADHYQLYWGSDDNGGDKLQSIHHRNRKWNAHLSMVPKRRRNSRATSAAYSVASATSANAGTYTVTVSNSTGSATSPANAMVVIVNAAPVTAPAPAPASGGGGGGAPSYWLYGALMLLYGIRKTIRRRKWAARKGLVV